MTVISFYPDGMKKPILITTLLCAFVGVLSFPAVAATPKSLGKYGYWSTYQMMEGGNPVCYMSITAKAPASDKAKSTKKKAKRGDVVLMVTHRPTEGSTDIISYAAGTKFRPASDVTFKIGGKEYSLFTQGDTAWARDQATDRTVVSALRSSESLTVLGVAADGSNVADTVNLKGIADAYYVIGKSCGLEVQEPPKKIQKAAPKQVKKAVLKQPAKTKETSKLKTGAKVEPSKTKVIQKPKVESKSGDKTKQPAKTKESEKVKEGVKSKDSGKPKEEPKAKDIEKTKESEKTKT
jgi:hypothetical protein